MVRASGVRLFLAAAIPQIDGVTGYVVVIGATWAIFNQGTRLLCLRKDSTGQKYNRDPKKMRMKEQERNLAFPIRDKFFNPSIRDFWQLIPGMR